MSDKIIDSPPTLFGAYIQTANLSIGYGADSGSCQLSLVYEKDGPLRDFDPEDNFKNKLGTALGFKFGECTFGGIFQRYTNKRSLSGYIWDIIIESPGKWLEGIQIILDTFQGNRFTINGVLTENDNDGVFTNQLNNIWNPYACREYYGYTASDGVPGIFGGSRVNSAGFPAIDALELIQKISQGKEQFGGKAIFGDSAYSVDLTEVIKITPPFFRLKGPVQSLSSIIQECCDIALHDYVVFIEPESGNIESTGEIEKPVIKVRVVDKSKPPNPDIIKSYINSYEKQNVLMSADFGKEFNDAVTQRLVIGGPATRYNFIPGANCYPVWGKIDLTNIGPKPYIVYDQARISSVYTGYTYGTGMNYNDIAPIVLKNTNTIYIATVLEVRCAMASFETWMLYRLLKDNTFPGFSNVALDPGTLQSLANGSATLNEILDSTVKKQQFFQGTYAGENILEKLNAVHNEIKQAGEEFYGKKFLVPLPVEGTYLPNNIKWLIEDQQYITSWDVSDSAWTESKPFLDIGFYDGDGKLKSTATWDINAQYDYSGLSESYAFNQFYGGIGTSQVDYLCKEIMFYSGTPFGLGAYVVVDTPPVAYFDQYTTDNYGLYHLFKLVKNINVHPNIMQTFGNENGPLSHRIAPARVAPKVIGVPQQSNRYSWGPWWAWSSKKGKAEVLVETELSPETFGSAALLDQVAFSYAYVPNANVGGNESGYVELPEIPKYNLATRFADSGPYVTNIDINIDIGGIKTTYKFNTWTPQFGKLAKYNADRISRINKNNIKFLQDQRSKLHNPPLPPLQASQYIQATPYMFPRTFGMHSMNVVLGQFIKTDDDKLKVNVQAGNLEQALISAPAPGKMQLAAFCSHEQTYSPVAIEKNPSGESEMPSLSQVEANDQSSGQFSENHVGPTVKELNPYFGQEKNDFQIGSFSSSTNYNLQKNNPETINTLSFRGPLLLSGWGYGLDDTCIPRGDDAFSFKENTGTDRTLWKNGPVHLMWDEERQVWTGGPQMVEGILIQNITAPQDPFNPTYFDIKLYRTKDWEHFDETITCVNRDPSLKVTNKPNKILVVAVRINYEWRPLWISCPDLIN